MQAAASFQRALAFHPRDAELHYNLGVCLEALGMADAAAQSFEASLAIDPKVAYATSCAIVVISHLVVNTLPGPSYDQSCWRCYRFVVKDW